MHPNRITYGDLDKLLRSLEFDAGKRTDACASYYHAASGTLILLPVGSPTKQAKATDIESVRLRIVSNGLLDENSSNDFFATGHLPLAS